MGESHDERSHHVFLVVSLVAPSASRAQGDSTGIASRYAGDRGIEKRPAVVVVEDV